MGQDFIRKAAASSQRSWRGGKERMDVPDLFSKSPKEARTVLADVMPGVSVSTGREYLVRASNEGLTLHDGERLVAKAKGDAAMLKGLEERGGYAKGTIVQVHPMSGAADVELK